MAAVWLPTFFVAVSGSFVVAIVENAGNKGAAKAPGLTLMAGLVLPLIQWMFGLGQTLMLLRIVRGEPTSVGDLFSGARYLPRKAAAEIVKGIMNVGMLILLWIPLGVAIAGFQRNQEIAGLILIGGVVATFIGLIALTVKYWPTTFVLVDRDPPGISCLGEAKAITAGRRWATVGLAIVAGLVMLAGYFALCIGWIFSIPVTFVMFAVAYCDMTGQPTMET